MRTHKLDTLQTIYTARFPRLASFLSLVRGSSADNADVTANEHSVMFRTTMNGDLCDFRGLSVA